LSLVQILSHYFLSTILSKEEDHIKPHESSCSIFEEKVWEIELLVHRSKNFTCKKHFVLLM